MEEIKKNKVITELATVINRNSLEKGSNTPDFILAEYLWNCLVAHANVTQRRDNWHWIQKSRKNGKSPKHNKNHVV